MPRIRTIKPEIFMSPQVMNLSRDARLLFIGLITQADDEGRGSADTRKLKGALFSGDEDITPAKVTALLSEIERQKLVATYQTGAHGHLYALPSFRQHQYIQRAKPSSYPAPPARAPEHSRNNHGGVSDASVTSIGGSEGSEGSEGSDSRPQKRPARQRAAYEGEEFHRQVVELYHSTSPNLPRVKAWTKQRAQALNARIRERLQDGKPADTVEYWRAFFEQVAASDFLTGRANGWRANLEWLLGPENFLKVIEGQYANGRAAHAR